MIFLNKSLIPIFSKYKKVDAVILKSIAQVQRGTLPPKPAELFTTSDAVKGNSITWFDGQVYRYTVIDGSKCWVDYNKLRENKPVDLFRCEKIMGRQLISRQFRMQFAYFDKETAFKKNLYAIYALDKNYDWFYILSILNSKFYSFVQVNQNTSGQRDDFPAFSLKDYREFLIPKLNKKHQEPFIARAKKLSKLAFITGDKDRDSKEFLTLDAELNEMVMDLYGLTKEEREIINKS